MPESKPINIGILGAARIAPKAIIAPASLRTDCRIFAVASRNLSKAKDFATTHNIPHAFDDYRAVAEHPEIDLIYNALPPNRHADLSIAALAAGKSVLCEKPFALNANEAEKMTMAARAAKGHLIEGFHYRFHPAALHLIDWVRTGRLGDLRSLTGYFNVPISNSPGELRYIRELGGGAFMDLGCYILHLCRTLTQSEPVILSASSINAPSGVDVAMQTNLQFGDVNAHIGCDMREAVARKISLSVAGSKGKAIFDQCVHPYRGFTLSLEAEGETRQITLETDETLYARSTYTYQLDHVIDVIHGRALALTGGDDALNTMKAIDAIYKMARTAQ